MKGVLNMNIKKANKQLKKVMRFLQENEKAFSMLDLKLHDVSYYCYSHMFADFPELYENDQDSYFYDFCECEYDCMIEYFKENNIEYKPQYIGRTSSFYLSDCVDCQCHRPYRIDFQQTIYNLLNENGYTCDCMPDITENGLIDTSDKYLKDCYANIDYIASGEFYKDVIKQLDDCIKAYNYIKSFKDNQVNIFKEYLQAQQEFSDYMDNLQGLTAAEIVLNNLDIYGNAI